jgi:hypothetical protein
MKRIAAAIAIAALCPVAANAAKPPKPPKPGPGNSLTLAASPSVVVSGRATAISGKLLGPNSGGQQVSLRQDPFPFDKMANAGKATTNATGDYSLTQTPTVNTRYQSRAGQVESPIVTVLVRPAVSLRLSDSTPRRGQRVGFSGQVCPEHDGSRVAIQRRRAGGFRTVARATLRDIPGSPCSRYRRTLRPRRDATYRTVIGGHADHATGVSGRRRVDLP